MISIESEHRKWSGFSRPVEYDGWLTPCAPLDSLYKVEELCWGEPREIAASEDEPIGIPPSSEGEHLAELAARAIRDWEAGNEA
jgi:hypothetical protein